jgi:rhomboid protease GluP
MALGGFNCPYCRYYNARDARRCGRCEKWLPPPFLAPAVRALRAEEYWATKLLAAVCVVVFALEMATSGGKMGLLTGVPMSTLLRFGAITNGLEQIEPWRLLAACFVHMGALHIAMNVIALADLGRIGEPMVGGPRFLLAFVLTGIVGFIVSAFWYGTQPYVTAGASGAVFGINGVILGDMILRKDPHWKGMLVRALVYSFIFYFAMGTNQAAHIGGLALGLILGMVYRRETRPWRVAWVVTTLTVVSLLAIAVSLVLPHRSSVWREVLEMERAREEGRPPSDDQ